MLKIKILCAALAVIASAGLVNCSEFQGTHSIPAQGPSLNSESPEATTGNSIQDQAALTFQQRLEHRAGIRSDLQRLSSTSFEESQCSQADQDSLSNQSEVINTGSIVRTFDPPLQRIKDLNQSVQQVQFASQSLARSLRNADNPYCAMNVAAEAAHFGIHGLLQNQASDVMSSEEYEVFVQKADHIRNALNSVVGEIQDAINVEVRAPFMEQVARNESLRSQITSNIVILGQMIELVRSSYNCDETTGCSQIELARGSAVVRTDAIIIQAQSALSRYQVEGPNDSTLEAKNNVLENHLGQLTERVEVMRIMVLTIETEQGATGSGDHSLGEQVGAQ